MLFVTIPKNERRVIRIQVFDESKWTTDGVPELVITDYDDEIVMPVEAWYEFQDRVNKAIDESGVRRAKHKAGTRG